MLEEGEHNVLRHRRLKIILDVKSIMTMFVIVGGIWIKADLLLFAEVLFGSQLRLVLFVRILFIFHQQK